MYMSCQLAWHFNFTIQSNFSKCNIHLLSKLSSKFKVYEWYLRSCYFFFFSDYTNLAVGVINECYKNDELYTNNILKRVMKNWGDRTIIEIALQSSNREFIASSACQELAEKIWKYPLKPDVNLWKVCQWTFTQYSAISFSVFLYFGFHTSMFCFFYR